MSSEERDRAKEEKKKGTRSRSFREKEEYKAMTLSVLLLFLKDNVHLKIRTPFRVVSFLLECSQNNGKLKKIFFCCITPSYNRSF